MPRLRWLPARSVRRVWVHRTIQDSDPPMAADSFSPGPDIDPASPEARAAQTFPRLDDEMAARVAAYGSEESLADGDLVYSRGQRGVDFFLVLDGCIEILD